MTQDERKVIELALKACENIVNSLATQDDEGMIEHAQQMIDARDAIIAMKELLAQPEQEPVAWSYWQSCLNDDGTQTAPWVHRLSKFKPTESIINKDVTPLYTTPPQRTWIGLTDEEMQFLATAIGQAKQIIDTYNTEFVTARDDLRRCSELLAAHNIKE